MKKIFFLILIGFSFFSSNAQVDRRIGTGQYKNGKNKWICEKETKIEGKYCGKIK